jgi:hypothetical protein
MHTVHNAPITLLATPFNNLGVGTILAGIVAPLVDGAESPPTSQGLLNCSRFQDRGGLSNSRILPLAAWLWLLPGSQCVQAFPPCPILPPTAA